MSDHVRHPGDKATEFTVVRVVHVIWTVHTKLVNPGGTYTPKFCT